MNREQWRRAAAALVVCGLLLAGCGGPDEDAVAVCEDAAEVWEQVRTLGTSLPDSADFDQVAPVIQRIQEATVPLQRWTAIDPEGDNGDVRRAAHGALAESVGAEELGGNAITGAELRSTTSIQSKLNFAELAVDCEQLGIDVPCLQLAEPGSRPIVYDEAFC